MTSRQFAIYEARYRELAAQVAGIGFVMPGTLTQRRTRCGKAGCRCCGDPPVLHGPYWQWSTKVDGKTVTRRLSDTEAALYAEWIANDRELRDLTKQMRILASKAIAIKLSQAKRNPAEV